MTEDLSVMNWEDAVKDYDELGDGCRLPIKEELNMLYKFKDKIGGFSNVNYWSITEGNDDNARRQNSHNATQVSYSKSFENYVRAVRAL
tara:strand:- start:1483 stop:1749 length:267 start_codon:yes stop_codon:yes gene_type:complete